MGGLASVSEFVLQRIQIKKKILLLFLSFSMCVCVGGGGGGGGGGDWVRKGRGADLVIFFIKGS